MPKECGYCTKCCEGHLEGESYGYKFSKDKPCYFLVLNQGCTIYEDRPSPQCTAFECWWKTDDSIPYNLKPNISDFMSYKTSHEGTEYFLVHDIGDKYSTKAYEWFKEYAIKNSLNIILIIGRENKIEYYGSEALDDIVKKLYTSPYKDQ